LHVEVDFSGFPIFVDLPQQRAGQTQQRGLVGKDSGDSGAPLEFHVDPFHGIACPHAALMGRWQIQDGQPFGKILLHPKSQFGSGLFIGADQLFDPLIGGLDGRTVEDPAYVGGHTGALVEFGHIGLGVLLKVELTSLPGHAREDRLAGGLEAGVVVTDKEYHATQAAFC